MQNTAIPIQGRQKGNPKPDHLRAKLLANLVAEFAVEHTDLATQFALRDLCPGEINQRRQGCILSAEDMRSYGPTLEYELSAVPEQRLVEALNSTLISISEFLGYEDEPDMAQNPQLALVRDLPRRLHAHIDQLEDARGNLESGYQSIQRLLTDIDDIHPRLQKQLVHALTTIPPPLNKKRSAQDDLLSTTIETSLLKLSLLRAQAHQSLYGYRSDVRNPETRNMVTALQTAHSKLQKEALKLDEEERRLDRQLDDYQRLLQLVDGSGTGFGQVVEDWVRVQKETEECRRDLRRLGWTGD